MILINATIHLSDNEEIVVNHRNRKNLSLPLSAKKNMTFPDFGVVSSAGSITFQDTIINDVYIVENYAKQGRLVEGLDVEVFVVNTLIKKTQKIGKYITGKWDYNKETHTVKVSIGDNLTKWQEINVPAYNFDAREGTKNFSVIYKYLHSITTQAGFDMLSYEELTQETRFAIERIICKYPYLLTDNLWASWGKLCQVCLLNIYPNLDGRIECRFTGG